MRRLIVASAALAALSVTASAADLPSKVPAAAPAAPSAFTWTGFYLGGHAGALIHNGSLALVGPGLVDPVHGLQPVDVPINPKLNSTGFKGGFHTEEQRPPSRACWPCLGLDPDLCGGRLQRHANRAGHHGLLPGRHAFRLQSQWEEEQVGLHARRWRGSCADRQCRAAR